MDSSSSSLQQQQQTRTPMAVDNEMNMYSANLQSKNERASPAPALQTSSGHQSVLNSNNSSSSTTASPTTPQLKTNQPQQQSQQQIKQEALHDTSSPTQILTKTRLQELVREVDATEQLDEDVEEILLQLADDFVETTVNAACLLAKHRKSNTVEVKDVQLHLERNWNMWLPGFGTDELRPYKRSAVTEAHKQRLALIRKTLKKY